MLDYIEAMSLAGRDQRVGPQPRPPGPPLPLGADQRAAAQAHRQPGEEFQRAQRLHPGTFLPESPATARPAQARGSAMARWGGQRPTLPGQ